MSQFLYHADYALWFANIILQWAVIVCLFWRRRDRIYPWFTGRMIFVAVKSLILLAVTRWGNYQEYFYVYWVGQAMEVGLFVLVGREIFYRIFTVRTQYGHASSRLLARIVTGVCVIFGVTLGFSWMTMLSGVAGVLGLSVTVNFTLTAAFVVIAIFARNIGIDRVPALRALIYGFAFLGIVTAVTDRVLATNAYFAHPDVRLVGLFAAVVAKLVWAWYLSRPIVEMPRDTPGILAMIVKAETAWRAGVRRLRCIA